MSRAIVLVLDSFGIGAAPDANKFGDVGANTFGSLLKWAQQQGRTLQIPNLQKMGLAHVAQTATGQWPLGLPLIQPEKSIYAAAAEKSFGKDTPSGHWEMMGVPVAFDWGYFKPGAKGENIFPAHLYQRWLKEAGLTGSLANCHASGTEVIQEWGDEHIRTGMPICYTSADSVFQIAAHEDYFSLERLLKICEIAKPIFDEAQIARVIARPFKGTSGHYTRTGNRRDYTTPPPGATLLDRLVSEGREVHAVGKISDIFAHRGITTSYKADGLDQIFEKTFLALENCPEGSLVFSNLVDFDMLYGHRRDVAGYAIALEKFDAWLLQLQASLEPQDYLALIADHGCDPSWPGSDHTRELVPLLLWNSQLGSTTDAGQRESFADLGQTLAKVLKIDSLEHGQVLPGLPDLNLWTEPKVQYV